MAYFGIDSKVRIEELHMKFKQHIRHSGKGGTASLKEQFLKFDQNKNGRLDL